MPSVAFCYEDQDAIVADVPDGMTVMRAGVGGGAPGIVGECGGQAMCGTCHVYVRDEFLAGLPPIDDEEEGMLEFAVTERDPVRSRLGCQLTLGPALPRLVVDVPPSNQR